MTDEQIVQAQINGMVITEIVKRSGRKIDDVRRVLMAAGRYRKG